MAASRATIRSVAANMEIAGSPVAHLRLSSSAAGGMVIVYLEDVAPNGRVTLVTQGLLNLAHRKPAAGDTGISADPLHSYLRADMMAMTPSAVEDVTIAISPIAAMIRKGHRLRVAFAGADDGNLERLPTKGAAALTVERGEGTYIDVPTVH